jgi:hypothetical protein
MRKDVDAAGQYTESDVETPAFSQRAQGLEFRLSEIRGPLDLGGNCLQPCAPVQISSI